MPVPKYDLKDDESRHPVHPCPAPTPPAEEPELAGWQQAFVQCPVCHRAVRRERLSKHLAILHAENGEAAEPPPAPADPAPAAPGPAPEAPAPAPRPQNPFRRALARLFGK